MKTLFSREFANTRHMLNPQRGYVNAVSTDLRATFERIRAAQQPQQKKGVRRVK